MQYIHLASPKHQANSGLYTYFLIPVDKKEAT